MHIQHVNQGDLAPSVPLISHSSHFTASFTPSLSPAPKLLRSSLLVGDSGPVRPVRLDNKLLCPRIGRRAASRRTRSKRVGRLPAALLRFARQGGPDLTDLRGVCIRSHPHSHLRRRLIVVRISFSILVSCRKNAWRAMQKQAAAAAVPRRHAMTSHPHAEQSCT